MTDLPTGGKLASIKTKSSVPALAAIAALFAMWGFAQWDFTSVLYKLTGFFAMSQAQINWIPAVLNVTYFLVAIPAAMFHRRFGYKMGMIVGLSVSSFGPFLLYPAIAGHAYPAFAAAVAVMTIGWPFLETCLNPLATELGPRESAVRRLNFVQSFFPVGLVIGVFVARWLLQFNLKPTALGLAEATARPFVVVGIAVLLFALAIDKVRFPPAASEKNTGSFRDELRSLIRRKEFLVGLAAIFGCQLAQATTWGTLMYYAPEEIAGAQASFGVDMLLVCAILAGVGRFTGTALMRWIDPAVLLGVAMLVGIALIAWSAMLGGATGFALVVITALFMAIAYPTIFGTAIRDLGPLRKTASGLLVTVAGAGSACELLVVNTLRGTIPIRYLILCVIPCFVMVLVFAIAAQRTPVSAFREKATAS